MAIPQGKYGNVRIEGLVRAHARVERLLNGLGDRVQDGLAAGARLAEDEAVKRTPVETGQLRASYLVTSETRGRTARAAVANTAEYAAYVHEQTQEKLRGVPRPGNRPGRHWDGGGSKFLERAVFENVSDIVEAIREASRFRRV